MLSWLGISMLIHKEMKLLRNQTGISLIEVLIGITLMLIIIAPIVSSLSTGLKSYQYNMAQNSNISSARELINTIADELRYATDISVSADAPITLSNEQNITYTIGGQSRSIYTIAGTPSTTRTLAISYNGAVKKYIAANDVQSITITRDEANNKKIVISAKFNDKSYANSPQLEVSTSLILPNI